MYGCSKNAKKAAYVAHVMPYLEYSVAVWSPHQSTFYGESAKTCSEGGSAPSGVQVGLCGPSLMMFAVRS